MIGISKGSALTLRHGHFTTHLSGETQIPNSRGLGTRKKRGFLNPVPAVKEHRKIFDVITTRDEKGAKQAMEKPLRNAIGNLKEVGLDSYPIEAQKRQDSWKPP